MAVTETERRVCASPGCAAFLSRYAPRGARFCAPCERSTPLQAGPPARRWRDAPPERARDVPAEPSPVAVHDHLGPVAEPPTGSCGPVVWFTPSQWTTDASMITETCPCQSPRYELMKLGGRRLVRRRETRSGAVHETELLPVRYADLLWEKLLAGHLR